jgi:hypothetical protein
MTSLMIANQNLVNAYLENPPKIQYENVPFPNLPKDKVVGLVTIRPKNKPSYFKKEFIPLLLNSTFIRRGSNTTPTLEPIEKTTATRRPLLILRIAQIIFNTLDDGVFDFINFRHKDMSPKYKVFKELFIICWAGIPKNSKPNLFISRGYRIDK